MQIDLIIPALNEASSISDVVAGVRTKVRNVVVVDNGSTDGTGDLAKRAGAWVVREPRRGYGAACLRGIQALPRDCEVVVFMDADGSDHPEDLPALIAPLLRQEADLVVGSRALGQVEPGALSLQQQVGNRIAASWLRRRFGLHATDLGPFRAIRYDALLSLGMADPDYGWTVEMQIKAARGGLVYREVPVRYRRRVGASKVSGTVRGVLGASYKILGMLAYYDLVAAGLSRHIFNRASQ